MAILDETEFDELIRIQRQMAGAIVREAEVDNMIKVISIVDASVTLKRKKVQVEHVLIEAQMQGLSEREAIATLEVLKTDGILFEPEPGYVQKS
jgi:DNA replicative helicase MCM subunit Mcm2 (Cdc46/Mcm family)